MDRWHLSAAQYQKSPIIWIRTKHNPSPESSPLLLWSKTLSKPQCTLLQKLSLETWPFPLVSHFPVVRIFLCLRACERCLLCSFIVHQETHGYLFISVIELEYNWKTLQLFFRYLWAFPQQLKLLKRLTVAKVGEFWEFLF